MKGRPQITRERSHSKGEQLFMLQARAAKFPAYEREFRIVPDRRWRFDFAWPERKIAVEVEGGVFVGGRHTGGVGYTKDCEKYNQATLLGWRIFRFTTGMVKDGTAMLTLTQALELT